MKVSIPIPPGRNVFFTSDFHLGHRKVITEEFDNRPFKDEHGNPDLEMMSNTLMTNWNNVVKKSDVVFYMGDLCFGEKREVKDFVHKLNGEIHFVMGNHDSYRFIKELDRFTSINDLVTLKLYDNTLPESYRFVLCHFPIYSWAGRNRGIIHIHGHTHLNIQEHEFHKTNRIVDVGCNGHDYTPVDYNEIIDIIEAKELSDLKF